MNFDEYMKKIQIISNILEQKRYAEDVLNSKELNIAQDFQYICLCSASNYNLVNEVIARLAQNGNRSIVEENIKNISISIWKDLFDKNHMLKDIFINNYNTILENAGIITFREIERFIENDDTRTLIYGSLGTIIKKLCTYDRASLIFSLEGKDGGIEKIKEHLECFFQKGEYDISTTYSKILIKLTNIKGLNSLDILIACNKYLPEMMSRETAIDNETNKLLNWLYDNFEETQMSEEQRAQIKQNIDKAILENFDNILDKSNYDRNTIKILKQFDCAREKFDKNKNLYIQKSIKQNHDTKIYSLNLEKQNANTNIEEPYKNIDEISKNEICEQGKKLQSLIKDKENIIDNEITFKEEIDLQEQNIIKPEQEVIRQEQQITKFNSILDLNIEEKNSCEIQEIKEDLLVLGKDVENFNNENQECDINIVEADKKQSFEEKKSEVNPLAEIIEAHDIIAEINLRVETFNTQMNSTKKINKGEENKQNDENQKLKLTTSEAEEIIKTLVSSHLYETEKIIDKVMKRDPNSKDKSNQKSVIEEIQKNEENINCISKNEEDCIKVSDIEETANQNISDNFLAVLETKTENIDTKIIEETKSDLEYNIKANESTALITKENDEAISVPENIFKRIWRKILNLFNLKFFAKKSEE